MMGTENAQNGTDTRGHIHVIRYDDSHFEEKQTKFIEECYRDSGKLNTWIHVSCFEDIKLVEQINDFLGIHPVIQEDIFDPNQRPKIEELGDYIYLAVRNLQYDDEKVEVSSDQISIIFGSNFVVSYDPKNSDAFDNIRAQISNSNNITRKMGADFLVWSIIDHLCDNYFSIMEKLGDRIEDLEDEMISNPTRQSLISLNNLKKQMIVLRRSVWPLREVVIKLERLGSDIIHEPTKVYLRDLYSETIQVIDTIEAHKEVVSGLLEIYLSTMSNRMNEVMKVLTVIATIFIPLSFVAGIYGMNLKGMPELEWDWGYPIVLSFMALVALGMLIYFRKKHWI